MNEEEDIKKFKNEADKVKKSRVYNGVSLRRGHYLF
jgi:hypothetical protein